MVSTARPWAVVIYDDPVNFMDYVTMCIQRIFGYSRERAKKHMLEVHEQGRSQVWSGNKEKAELYVHQLHAAQLQASLERAGE
ncbi:ATP-dependent Clp protease adapter ClpS [Verrucomicrobiales bacterium T37]